VPHAILRDLDVIRITVGLPHEPVFQGLTTEARCKELAFAEESSHVTFRIDRRVLNVFKQCHKAS
jgi:hypothetical protein